MAYDFKTWHGQIIASENHLGKRLVAERRRFNHVAALEAGGKKRKKKRKKMKMQRKKKVRWQWRS